MLDNWISYLKPQEDQDLEQEDDQKSRNSSMYYDPKFIILNSGSEVNDCCLRICSTYFFDKWKKKKEEKEEEKENDGRLETEEDEQENEFDEPEIIMFSNTYFGCTHSLAQVREIFLSLF